jgi:hypothetical protein
LINNDAIIGILQFGHTTKIFSGLVGEVDVLEVLVAGCYVGSNTAIDALEHLGGVKCNWVVKELKQELAEEMC